MKTRQAAGNMLKSWFQGDCGGGYVFQRPDGKWDCCTFDSATGQNISRNLSLAAGIRARAVWRYLNIYGTWSEKIAKCPNCGGNDVTCGCDFQTRCLAGTL